MYSYDRYLYCADVQSSSQRGTAPQTSERPREVEQKTKTKLSLFDDEDDDADLFAVSSTSTSKTTKPTAGDTSKVQLQCFTYSYSLEPHLAMYDNCTYSVVTLLLSFCPVFNVVDPC